MGLSDKLISKIKDFFVDNDQKKLLDKIKQAIRAEITTKQLIIKTGRGFYIPDNYKIFLSREDKEYIISNGYDKFIFDFINDKVKFNNKRVKDKLEVNFFSKKNLDGIMIESDFSNKPININQRRSTDTIIYSGVEKNSESESKIQKISQTLQLNNNFKISSKLEILSDNINLDSVKITAVETNIGRQRSNEVVLFDPSVSRVHAQIVKKKYYYLIKDLNSTNGVIVNNNYVKEKILNNGDLILLGDIKLKFILSSQ